MQIKCPENLFPSNIIPHLQHRPNHFSQPGDIDSIRKKSGIGNFHKCFYLRYFKIIPLPYPSRSELASFDVIVHGSAADPEHLHHIIGVYPFRGEFANRVYEVFGIAIESLLKLNGYKNKYY
jgi:hypothetical protein